MAASFAPKWQHCALEMKRRGEEEDALQEIEEAREVQEVVEEARSDLLTSSYTLQPLISLRGKERMRRRRGGLDLCGSV